MPDDAAINDPGQLLPTRRSLVSRLKDWGDQESWKTFFDTYWKLIYHAAIKAGLTDHEAQEVVQETVITVLKNIPGFKYTDGKSSFKAWLLHLTSWRISDQLRRRQREDGRRQVRRDTATGTDPVERVADPGAPNLEAIWDEEWESNLKEAAIRKVKTKVDPKQYQVFDLHVLKQWPVSRVTKTLGISTAKVYVIKHRIGKLIKKEIISLSLEPVQSQARGRRLNYQT
jgi:RNA polymerase sigma-70 factor (ECF subfamily)